MDRTDNVLDLPFVRHIIGVFQDNCPERLGFLYVCPAPFIFRALWAIIRPWLNKKTQEKVKLVGTCEELKEYISPDQIPKRMGGTDEWEHDPKRDIPRPSADVNAPLEA